MTKVRNKDIKIGFIGLGNMGLHMAHNLLKSGFSLRIFNRSREKGNDLLKQGAQWSLNPQELASHCDIVLSIVSDDKALSEIVEGKEGIFQAEKKPLIHLSMSTVSPSVTDDLEKKHQDLGIKYLSAPVSGRPERAKKGTLWIFLAGDQEAKIKAQPVLQVLSEKIFDLGDKPSRAALFKLCSNFLILSFVETLAEATLLLEKEGMSVENALEVWGNSFFDAPLLHAYKPLLSKGNFAEAGFSTKLGLKDIKLLKQAADQAQISIPLLDEIHGKLLDSMNLGREDFDWSAIFLLSRNQ